MNSAGSDDSDRRSAGTTSSFLDWLPGDSEMLSRMRQVDWSNTPLGSPADWPINLRTALSLCLTSRFPILIWWSSQMRVFYNDAYIPFLGQQKHPRALGQPGKECWAEIWDSIGPMLDGVYRTGQATWSQDYQFFFDRNLRHEEVYVTFTYGPILSDDGRTVEGVFCPCTETTEKIVGARRLETLRDLGVEPLEATTVDAACEEVLSVLARNPYDVAFVALYRARGDGQDFERCSPLGGVDSNEPSWPVRDVAKSRSARELTLAANTPPFCGIAWPEPITTVRLIPLLSSTHETVSGVAVFGVSPRCPFDDSYRVFLDLAAGHIATAIANAQALEHERRRAQALADIDRAKTVFFSNISHEFRTPITLLLGPLEQVLDGRQLDPSVREQLELARGNSLRLLKLVNSLLEFSRVEAGRARASFQPVDLAALTRDLASTFRSAIERAQLQFDVECDTLSDPAYVDLEMWERIVLNLLSNAFKFTLSGHIAVRLRQEGSTAVLLVEDTGAGIPSSELPRLFERFYRIEGQVGRSQEGSGIGLALIKELVGLHGGQINVSSEHSMGSTFEVRLPLGNRHLPAELLAKGRLSASISKTADAYVQEALRWLPSPATSSTTESPTESALPDDQDSAPIQRFRILLADDNSDMRSYVRGLLAPSYIVETVANGLDALDAARRERPDLILSDVMMPQLDGLALLQRLRADDALRDIPVMLLSARAGEEARIEGLDVGPDDYVVKPFSAKELLARVDACLRLAKQRREFNEQIAADLEAMTRLQAVGARCARTDIDVKECLTEVLQTAIWATAAAKGNIQLIDGHTNVLRIVVQQGFGAPFLEFFETVGRDESAACGSALAHAERVIVEDVTRSDLFAGQPALRVLRDAGVMAVQSTPLVSSAGQVLGMISTHFEKPHRPDERALRLIDLLARQAADYLERQDADRQLQASRAQFQTIVNNSPLGVYLLDENLRIRLVNPIALPVFGDIPNLIGRDLDDIVRTLWPRPYADEIVGIFRHTLETGESYRTSERIEKRLDRGVLEFYEYQVHRIPLPDGPFGVVCYFRDISEAVLARRRLEAEGRQKNEFLAMLAHELRNPLAPIRSAAELLGRAQREPEQTRAATDILKRQVTLLARLVDDLLDVSRITQGRIELKRDAVAVSDIVAQAVETVQPLIREKQHRVTVINENVSRVLGDSARLVQCVVNLLNNAAKYTDRGGQIRVECTEDNGLARVRIIDNGPGISPELLPHVFDLFVQSERTLDRSQGGLGIGLSIVKRLIEMHGGAVSARSDGIERGAIFELSLPVLTAEVAVPEKSVAPTLTPRRVLIVDDNRDAAESLEMLLQFDGHQAESVFSGQAALEKFPSFRPQLVLLDIGLPGCDGYEVARRLRALPECRDVRLIALTGYGQMDDRKRALDAGFDDHVIKPVEIDHLKRLLDEHARGKSPPIRQ